MEWRILHSLGGRIRPLNCSRVEARGGGGQHLDLLEMSELIEALESLPMGGRTHCTRHGMLHTLYTTHMRQNIASPAVASEYLGDLRMPTSRWPRQREISSCLPETKEYLRCPW